MNSVDDGVTRIGAVVVWSHSGGADDVRHGKENKWNLLWLGLICFWLKFGSTAFGLAYFGPGFVAFYFSINC
ncbi:unnamed protein product [Lathyrus oleraceus]